MALQGLVSFPGINQVRFCRYTRSLGTLPDVAILEMVPQSNPIADQGDLVWTFGATSVTMPDCCIDFGSIRMNEQGQIVSLRIMDRRWKWKFRQITGHYNVRRGDNSIIPDTEKTPQELAELLLVEMGEPLADFSQLPNGTRPEVHWEQVNAANELSTLCDLLGCKVAYRFDNLVHLVRTGVGALLPNNDDVQSVSWGLDNACGPDVLRFVAGPTLWQAKLLLEAVGWEQDGSIKPIDELSYKPTNGWEFEHNPDAFLGVTNEQDRNLANQSVWRWYRVKAMADGGLDLFPRTLTNISQIFPITHELLTTFTDIDGEERPHEAFVEGTFLSNGAGQPSHLGSNSDDFTRLDAPWRILDENTGLIGFRDAVVKNDNGQHKPADLYLTTSFGVRETNANGRDRERFTHDRGSGILVHVIRRDEERLQYVFEYGSDNVTRDAAASTDNEQDLIDEAEFQLDGAELEFQNVTSVQVRYRGLFPIQPDGAVRQVRFEVSMTEGCRTWASRNSEFDPQVLRYKERRRVEKQEHDRVSLDLPIRLITSSSP